MSRGTWTIQKKVTSTWTADGTIYRPNENLVLNTQSTQKKVTLADGSEAYYTPSTKYLSAPMTFIWQALPVAFVTKLKAYITNQNDIKIIDHDSVEYVGRFLTLEAMWLVGTEDSQEYNVTATFEQMPSLA